MDAMYIEEQLNKNILSPREKCLMSLLFSGKLTENSAHVLLDNLDLDTANQNYILMLSCLGYTKGWKYFPPEIQPRLKGVHYYHHIHNSMGIPWLLQQLQVLTDNGIPVMLLKGIAMLAYYAPDKPRLMWDYDIAVPNADFERALPLLLTGENTLMGEYPHSAAIKGARDEIDLHRWIFKTYGERSTDIWEHAETFCFHGINVRVPAPEDMLIHLLDNQSRNYFQVRNYLLPEGAERRMQWLYDCRRVWEFAGGINLKYLADRAAVFHATERVRMTLKIFMQCFPELIDLQEFERYFPLTASYKRMLVRDANLVSATIRHEKYAYADDGVLTPLRIWRSLRKEIAIYRSFAAEMRWKRPRVTFISHIKKRRNLNNFPDFLKKYLFRIHL
ncbi:MAG: nucleotidyltransferase family protein, partial [Clostridium sp.]|nr:nucleotidyltransferase family protein [Clostridium sp.]